jgi:hypothetical protein
VILLFQPCRHFALLSFFRCSGWVNLAARLPLRKVLAAWAGASQLIPGGNYFRYFFVGSVCPHFLQTLTLVSPSTL